MDTTRPTTLFCEKCGEEFLVARRGPMVYLCGVCRGVSRPKRPYKAVCWQCHEEFVVPRTGKMRYRCKECQAKVNRALRKLKE